MDSRIQRMILIADRNGQLGNRLFNFAHFIGWGMEHGVSIANPGFWEYARYFEGTFRDPWCRYPVRAPGRFDVLTRQLAYSPISFVARQARKINIHTPWLATRNNRGDVFALDAHTSELLSSRLTVVRGWPYRDKGNFQKYRDAIRVYFRPRPVHLQRISESVAAARKGHDVLVGIHIRRGDYINHLGGKYFYDQPVYRAIMDNVLSLFGDRRVGFLICSNEQIDLSIFDGLNFHLGPNHIVEDLYSFAACDYLIGPPSTYTMWASYYGKVPLFQMTSASRTPLKLTDFRVH